MLLLSSPRSRQPRRAALLPLAALLLCVSVSVSAGLPASFYPDLDEEIDILKSIIEKQSPRVPEHQSIKGANKQTSYLALVTSEQKFKKGRVGSPHRGQKSNVDASTEKQHAVTQAPDPPAPAVTNTPTPQPKATGDVGRGGHIMVPAPENDKIIIIMISLCVAVGTVAVILATVCYIKLQKESRLAQKVDYPAFGGAGVPAAATTGTSMGDKNLAQNAQMYHYQHQKQQMLSMGNHKPEQNAIDNEVTSDEEEVGGDFTVYECPGLAPTGEMEVKNPLFDDSAMHYQGNPK